MPILGPMRAVEPAPSAERRVEPGLQYHPQGGRLTLGTEGVDLAPGAGNRAVLAAYVDLTAKRRGRSVAEVIEVRQVHERGHEADPDHREQHGEGLATRRADHVGH